jgi:hypothetical protein
MSGYYKRYENKNGLNICFGLNNSVLSIENLDEVEVYFGKESSSEPDFSLKPGEKLTFGPNTLYEQDLKAFRKSAGRNYDDEDDNGEDTDSGGFDCHD